MCLLLLSVLCRTIFLFVRPISYYRYFDIDFLVNTGGLRFLRIFYLQICLFTLVKLVQNDNFLVKNGLFICKFSIRGPKWRNVSTANYEGNLSQKPLVWNLMLNAYNTDIYETSFFSFSSINQEQNIPCVWLELNRCHKTQVSSEHWEIERERERERERAAKVK